MLANVGRRYAGLTDYPSNRQLDHACPKDWSQNRFDTEQEARVWLRLMFIRGYLGKMEEVGWRFGYTFTCTRKTRE